MIKIYSGDDLAVIVQEETIDPEHAYLVAALHLIEWAKRNEGNHASRSTGRSEKWLKKLSEQLNVDSVDNQKSDDLMLD